MNEQLQTFLNILKEKFPQQDWLVEKIEDEIKRLEEKDERRRI